MGLKPCSSMPIAYNAGATEGCCFPKAGFWNESIRWLENSAWLNMTQVSLPALSNLSNELPSSRIQNRWIQVRHVRLNSTYSMTGFIVTDMP